MKTTEDLLQAFLVSPAELRVGLSVLTVTIQSTGKLKASKQVITRRSLFAPPPLACKDATANMTFTSITGENKQDS